ncbi:uncharacterized protein FFNC_15644 [Fusarium fujikuroi]|nr:uncharacterized protein FFNC_15644 [Fusarium fujikuroi]
MPIGSGQLLSLLLLELLDRTDQRFERKLAENNENEHTPNTGKAVKATSGGTSYFDLSSMTFEPPSDQSFQTPDCDALTAPILFSRESTMRKSSIGSFDDLRPAGVVLESQGHQWDYGLNNLAMSSEYFDATNFLDLPGYPCDLF